MILQISNSKSAIFTKRSSIKIFLLFLVTFFINNINSVKAQCWDVSYIEGNYYEFPSSLLQSIYNVVSIVDDSLAYVSSFAKGEERYTSLSKTMDGGKSWKKITTPFDNESNTILHFQFFGKDTAWLVLKNYLSDLLVYTTTNGAKTWNLVLSCTQFNMELSNVRAFFAENSKTIWILTSGGNNKKGLFYTNDFGKNWNYIPQTYLKDSYGIHVKSNGEGWQSIIDNNALLKRSQNTFDFQFEDNNLSGGARMSFKKDVGALMVDVDRTVAITQDYGKNWIKTLSYKGVPWFDSPHFWCIEVVDSSEVIIGGWITLQIEPPTIVEPLIKKTRDGGKTWKAQKLKLGENIHGMIVDIKSYSRDYAIAVGDTNRVYIYRRPPAPICDLKILSNDTLKNNDLLTWSPASGCIGGYYLSIGTAPNKKDILDSVDIEDVLQYSLKNIQPKQSIYVILSPYNDGGVAPPCMYKKIYLEQCTVKTRLDTIIKPGTEIDGIIYLQDTIITKVYKSTKGCDSLVNLYVDVLTSSQELETAFIQPLRVNPNPTSSNLQVIFQLKKATKGRLAISDKLGRIMWKTEQKEWNTGLQNVEIDVSNYPSGVYQLIWNDNSGLSVVNWVKMN